MSISPGTRIGAYEVGDPLGVGGMGEVYRARDTKLDRDVALKILPDDFASDPERLARFQREAKVLASLNHPNIAAIYGLEDRGETHALVLELVEGPTLAELIERRSALGSGPRQARATPSPSRGGRSALGTATDSGSRREPKAHSHEPASNRQGLPVDEALPIARQIAEALEAAHEQGIVHRDLKPANVKVTPDGVVKVLDFGLAKAIEEGARGASEARGVRGEDLAESPTVSMSAAATRAGFILGTAAYMSPEQARGKPVDRRTDIWSFGVVLFEMLTGSKLFDEPLVSDTLAAVVRDEIDLTALPAGVPASVRRRLRRCLEHDRRRRLQHIGDARLEIDEASDPLAPLAPPDPLDQPAHSLWQRPLPLLAAAALLVATSVLVTSRVTTRDAAATGAGVARAVIALEEGQTLSGDGSRQLAISPDGRYVAYVSNEQLYLRPIDRAEATRLAESRGDGSPVFSPDGQWIGFGNDGRFQKVPVTGGAPIDVEGVSSPGSVSWTDDDAILRLRGAVG